MLKIMIRENSTQRGNENFGAVLDSVGAVLVQCVKEVYNPENVCTRGNISEGSIKGNLESGVGIGWQTITAKEPAFSRRMVDSALATFRTTGTYLKLLFFEQSALIYRYARVSSSRYLFLNSSYICNNS